MTDDLVKRLRTQGAGEDGYRTVFNGLLNDAASALESLSAENARLIRELEDLNSSHRDLAHSLAVTGQRLNGALELLRPFAAEADHASVAPTAAFRAAANFLRQLSKES